MVKKENMKNLKSEIQNPLMKWDALNKRLYQQILLDKLNSLDKNIYLDP